MDIQEVKRCVGVSRSASICVDVRLDPNFPGYVRTVEILPGYVVRVEYNVFETEEGGPRFECQFERLEDAIRVVESYLGRPLELWENANQTGEYPELPDSVDSEEGHRKLRMAIRSGTISLPKGAFVLKGTYWVTLAEAGGLSE